MDISSSTNIQAVSKNNVKMKATTKGRQNINENDNDLKLKKYIDYILKKYIDGTKNSNSSQGNSIENLRFKLTKGDILEFVKPLLSVDLLYSQFQNKMYSLDTTSSFSILKKKRTRIRMKQQPKAPKNNKIIKNSNKVNNIFQIKKVNKVARKRKLKKKRKFNKDCILKKIKSRFFKYFINKHMINFVTYIHHQKIYKFKDNIIFHRLDDYFVKDVTIKRNTEWGFINKSPFQLFHDYSGMRLKEIYDIYNNNRTLFNDIIKNMEGLTAFVLFEPFSTVFNGLMADPTSFEFLCEKVKVDLERKNTDSNNKDQYFSIFKDNVAGFINYYANA